MSLEANVSTLVFWLGIGDFEKALVEVASFLEVVDFVDECVHVLLGDLDNARFRLWLFYALQASRARSCKARARSTGAFNYGDERVV